MTNYQDKLINKIEELKATAETQYLDYAFYGIRFDYRDNLEEGFVFNSSKDNSGRYDERDFPEFGTDEYAEMDDLDGTSAYDFFDGEAEEESAFSRTIIEWFADEDLEGENMVSRRIKRGRHRMWRRQRRDNNVRMHSY